MPAAGQFKRRTACAETDLTGAAGTAHGDGAADAGFSDVPADADYAAAVSWAVETGVANGFPGNVFNPGDTCTRGQIVAFLHRAYVPEVRV